MPRGQRSAAWHRRGLAIQHGGTLLSLKRGDFGCQRSAPIVHCVHLCLPMMTRGVRLRSNARSSCRWARSNSCSLGVGHWRGGWARSQAGCRDMLTKITKPMFWLKTTNLKVGAFESFRARQFPSAK